MAFSPDGRWLAAAEASTPDEIGLTERTPARVRIWDLRSRELTPASMPVSSPSIAFSPDGRRLAIATLNLGRTDIRDVRDGRLVARLPNADLVRSVAWAPDGELLATGEYDGNGQLWSTKTWKRVGPALEGHERRLLELEFSPDGSLLSSSGADGTVRLWDVATRRAVGSPLKVEEDNVFVATAFAPSGTHVFAASGERRAVRWNVSPAAWKRHACQVAGRELTRQEWKEALPGRPYRSVCSAG
jgi:WD40 repeat protein